MHPLILRRGELPSCVMSLTESGLFCWGDTDRPPPPRNSPAICNYEPNTYFVTFTMDNNDWTDGRVFPTVEGVYLVFVATQDDWGNVDHLALAEWKDGEWESDDFALCDSLCVAKWTPKSPLKCPPLNDEDRKYWSHAYCDGELVEEN